MRGAARSFLSRISVRVLAFNVLVVFLPIAGVLSLGTYEKQLLDSLERSLVQQGRALAAGLEDAGPRLPQEARRHLQSLRQRHEARIRVVDSRGVLLADTSSLFAGTAASAAPGPGPSTSRPAQQTFLYRMASFPVRAWRRYLRPPQPPPDADEYYSGARVLAGPEIADALAGGYGAETRISTGQQSVTLYSAIPITSRGKVIGAVLVSQSTFRILSDLYALRLDIFRLFLWSVATAVVLSLLVSSTITVPVRRLRDRARAILDPRGRLLGGFVASRARDEVGELSRSLGELTARLQRHVRLLESFASDVSHELKNPLASIRAATEIALSSANAAERRAMLSMVQDDVDRMERLLTGVREISRIDSGAGEGEGRGPRVRLARAGAAPAGAGKSPGQRGRLLAAGRDGQGPGLEGGPDRGGESHRRRPRRPSRAPRADIRQVLQLPTRREQGRARRAGPGHRESDRGGSRRNRCRIGPAWRGGLLRGPASCGAGVKAPAAPA